MRRIPELGPTLQPKLHHFFFPFQTSDMVPGSLITVLLLEVPSEPVAVLQESNVEPL